MFHVSLMVTTKHKATVTKDEEKGIKAYHNSKSSMHKGRLQERNKGTAKNSQKTIINTTLINTYLSIITLTVKRLNYPIKRQSMRWIK